MAARYSPGDLVIFRMTKRTAHPGPRAKSVAPETRGEGYVYEVDKFWVVAEAGPNGQLLLRTRRGKVHQTRPDDPRLRPARWWERLWYRSRFPRIEPQPAPSESHGAPSPPAG